MQFNPSRQLEEKRLAAKPVQTKAQRLDCLSVGVNRCGLFGSFVKETSADDSDVDILVDFEPAKETFDNFMVLSFLLEDLFGCNVDLVMTQSLSPHIGPHILAEVKYVSFYL